MLYRVFDSLLASSQTSTPQKLCTTSLIGSVKNDRKHPIPRNIRYFLFGCLGGASPCILNQITRPSDTKSRIAHRFIARQFPDASPTQWICTRPKNRAIYFFKQHPKTNSTRFPTPHNSVPALQHAIQTFHFGFDAKYLRSYSTLTSVLLVT